MLGAEIYRKVARAAAVALLAVAVSTPVFVGTPSEAAGDTRSLKLYFIHTGEKAVITYKRNGKFDPKGLEQLNRFLRDWRRNQPTKMDPRLFDLIWEVYRQSGSRDYINVVCGFRSPQTNSMLRSRSSGVAEKSQHMLGKAMDFFIPGVKLARLREIGMKMEVGGVGFYPKSGSPFVHMDVGGVRAWPRMSRQELVRLFPDGKTMHIPTDGKPLPGYQQAVAAYKQRAGSARIEIASASDEPRRRGFLASLFGGGADEEEDSNDSAPTAVAKAAPATPATPAAPEQPAAEPEVEVASVNAPVPQVRPAFANQPADNGMTTALVSPASGNAAQQALAAALPADQSQEGQHQAFADLSGYSIPVPSLLGPRRMNGDAEAGVLTASADPAAAALSGQSAGVPLPVERPAVAEALLASANADVEAEGDEAEQEALSPAVIAALEQQRLGDGQMQTAAAMPAQPGVAPAQGKATLQLAALAPATRQASFGDGFDVPSAASGAADASAVTPSKGGRPTKHEAEVADASRATIRTEPKLTQKIISQWALTNARMETVAKPVKAPRFVSQTLREQPTAVYAEGFNVKTASIDPGRFSGSAVNFMEVRKFNTN
ncbi:uncharacterized protein YcbK (DUF882 family) [Rhizobium sp. BK251]|nr:uncharacterized protein YcbK (DUF882 family) [Rhizobium sp. BK251]